jgi:zinc transport system substrate-binding protein
MAGCTGNTSKKKSNGKIRITTSFYTMYDFAKKIGGDKVEVINLVPAGTEPHDWEPSTKDLIEMEKSDIFIYNGAGMEQWVDDVLESLDTEELTSVEASKGIKLLKDQDAHEHDHEHNSENDPHVWLDPQNAKYEMNKIKKALIKVDAENKDYYEANYKRYAKECDKLDTLYKEETSKFTKKELVVAHEAFGYLCHAYGLEQMGIEGLSADDEPDPKQMSEVIRFAKEHQVQTIIRGLRAVTDFEYELAMSQTNRVANQVKTIFFEELVSPKVAKTIAKETGANAKMLNPLEGLSNKKIKAGEDYFSVMKQNLAAIKEALSE